jgi:2-C-methyl-D-erythritol 4-phosphate cytidylyltransferase
LPHSTELEPRFIAIVPAAGIGKRMQSEIPKQYLKIGQLTILEHTVNRLLTHAQIDRVIIALNKNDPYFAETNLASNEQVDIVIGGKERVDSVLAGLKIIDSQKYPWVLVHDAARPCVSHKDISALISDCTRQQQGGILAYATRDTMKRSNPQQTITHTENRENLWHALTPQLFQTVQLITAIEQALHNNISLTDESSAIEALGLPSRVVEGASDNIKITTPSDLALATFILQQQREKSCE